MSKFFSALLALLTGALLFFPQSMSADGMPTVVINELLWMGSSVSSTDEWVELRNTTSAAIDVAGWRLTKRSGGNEVAMLTIAAGLIPANGLFVIANDPAATSRLAAEPNLVDASISLVNSQLQISLYDAANILIDRADDGSGAPLAGEYSSGSVWKSMERNPTGIDGTIKESWHTTSVSMGFDDAEKEWGTPGIENSNLPPALAVTVPETARVGEQLFFDGSETTDPENDPLTLRWTFSDGMVLEGTTVERRFQQAGAFSVEVTANDGRGQNQEKYDFTVQSTTNTSPESPAPPNIPSTPISSTPPSIGAQELPLQKSNFIQINEVLPDPEGRDEIGEFIELVNIGAEAVNLRGWKLTDTKTDYVVRDDLVIEEGQLLTFFRPTTKIMLNNTNESLFLVDPFKTVVNGVAYESAEAGRSFSRVVQKKWLWSTPTPGERNLVEEEETEGHNRPASGAPDKNDAATVTIAKARTLAKRTKVVLRGTIIVEPGVLGKNLFYIVDGAEGIQVFSSKGDFPELSVGDVVELRGAVGEASGERKLNIQKAEDVIILDQAGEPDPVLYNPNHASGLLVAAEGGLKEKRGSSIWIETAEGTLQATATRSSGVSFSEFQENDKVRIVGVWRVTKDGARLYPRSDEDLEAAGVVKADTVEESATSNKESSPTLLDVSTNTTSTSSLRSIGFPVLAVGAFAGGYFWWRRKKRANPSPSLSPSQGRGTQSTNRSGSSE